MKAHYADIGIVNMIRQRLKDIDLQRWLSEINNDTRKDTSSETQGQIVGTRKSLNGRKIYGTKKSKERREEPGSSRRSLLFFVPYIFPLV